jgi:O-antigen/teichoic acid export membrane protein
MLSTADTFVLKPHLTPEFLGYYQIGNLVRDTLLLLTSSVAGVALPAYGQLFGATGSRQALESKYLTHIFYLALFIPLLCAAAWFLLPPAVALVMPRFLPGAQHLSRLALSMAPLMLVPLPASLLIVIGKQKQLIAVMGGFLGLLLLVNSWWIVAGDTASSPFLNTITYWLLLVVLVSYTHFLLTNGMKKLLRLLRFLLPLLLGTLLLWTPLLFFTSERAPAGVSLLVFAGYPFFMFWFHKRRDPRIQAMKIVGKKDKSHE